MIMYTPPYSCFKTFQLCFLPGFWRLGGGFPDGGVPLSLLDVVEIAKVYNCPLQTLTLVKYIRAAGASCKEDLEKLLPVGPPGIAGDDGIPVTFSILLYDWQFCAFRE